MNRLAKERSAYLRHAAHQAVDWRPWSDEAFEKAKQEDKPVFLSTGAVWCHWCHVMAKECFENEEITKLMNRLFVNIKLDRDERPDIDRRYQQAVAAMGGGSGWPLSVFLTPEGKPFLGGTYFPPEDRNGRPGFKTVLKAASDFYASKKQDARRYAGQVMEALKPEALTPGALAPSAVDDAAASMLSLVDLRHGGFGAAPKFPMPGALEFLIRRSFLARGPAAGFAARKTLDSMAKGGIHDQLGGGFHRYSVDEEWLVPHFEKMADDNAWLLRNYIDGYAVFREERFKEVAQGIIRFVGEVLSDPAGGFYASQDADVTPDDEGGYFTWTEDDFKRVLTPEEYGVLSLHLFHERGSMHHDPAKKVLAVAMEPGEIAEKTGTDVSGVLAIIGRGKEKLLAERRKRETPFIDTSLYTSLNGMFIASYLRAYRVLDEPALKEFALKSLARVLKERLSGKTLLHFEGVPAVLDDYVYLIEALVAAYEVTAERPYLARADELMRDCMEKFSDTAGGFFDTERDVLGMRLKRIEDIPHPSANGAAVMALLRLYHLTGTEAFRSAAEESLRIFIGSAREMAVHGGSYFCALDASFTLLRLTVAADPGSALAVAARALDGPYTAVAYGEDRGQVLPCIGTSCYEPVKDAAGLADFLNHTYGTPQAADAKA
jgi:uncharacterized protein